MITHEQEIEQLRARVAELEQQISIARRIAESFAAQNQKHIYKGMGQDPYGVHAWLVQTAAPQQEQE